MGERISQSKKKFESLMSEIASLPFIKEDSAGRQIYLAFSKELESIKGKVESSELHMGIPGFYHHFSEMGWLDHYSIFVNYLGMFAPNLTPQEKTFLFEICIALETYPLPPRDSHYRLTSSFGRLYAKQIASREGRRGFMKKVAASLIPPIILSSIKTLHAETALIPSGLQHKLEVPNGGSYLALPTDYKEIFGDARFIAIGETDHKVTSIPEELTRSMPVFKQLGITHFGLEMLNNTSQGEVNAYQDGTISRFEMRAVLDRDWFHKNRGQEKALESLLSMIDAATASGIKIIAVDTRDFGHSNEKRNYDWQDIVVKILSRDNKSKVMVLGGDWHMFFLTKNLDSCPDLVSKQGYKTAVFFIVSSNKDPLLGFFPNYGYENIARQAEQLGISNSRFMLDARSDPKYHCWFVFAPQKK